MFRYLVSGKHTGIYLYHWIFKMEQKYNNIIKFIILSSTIDITIQYLPVITPSEKKTETNLVKNKVM